MKVMKLDKGTEESNPIFVGGTVMVQPLVTGEMEMRLVNFGKGARTRFHTHKNDQVLIVTAGRGIVATEKEELVVGVGDVIHFPAGERHWHGATKDSEFSHIFVMSSDTLQIED